MADKPLPTLLRYLRRLARPAGGALSDGQLLERFVRDRDEAAFELLVWRHGPMVLNVCRRLLPAADAEDAFQATFLVFVRKAHAVRQREGVAGWLYRVAYRVALRARGGAARRARHEKPGLDLDAVPGAAEAGWSDLRPVLDEEISRLPERYRVPVVLCYLEGRTNQEAAEHLGCAEGTVASRLARARARLRARLTRRGLALGAGALGVAVTREASAGVPPALVETTLRAALQLTGGKVAAGLASAKAAALAEGVMRTMLLTKVRMAVAALLLAGVGAGVLGGGLVYRGLASEPAGAGGGGPAGAQAAGAAQDRHLIDVPSRCDGVLVLVGTEIKDGEKVPPGRVVAVKVGEETKKYRRLRVGDAVEEGQLLAQVDDQVARDQLAIAQQQLEAAKADRDASEKTRDEAKERYRTLERLYNSAAFGTRSLEDLRAAKLTWDRYFYDEVGKREAIKKVEAEVRAALTVVKLHEIRSPVNGTITKIYKHRGEGVKAYEAVFQVLTAPERDD